MGRGPMCPLPQHQNLSELGVPRLCPSRDPAPAGATSFSPDLAGLALSIHQRISRKNCRHLRNFIFNMDNLGLRGKEISPRAHSQAPNTTTQNQQHRAKVSFHRMLLLKAPIKVFSGKMEHSDAAN